MRQFMPRFEHFAPSVRRVGVLMGLIQHSLNATYTFVVIFPIFRVLIVQENAVRGLCDNKTTCE